MKTYPKEILDQIKVYFVEKNSCWVIQLGPAQFLHWIESTDHTPCTVNRPEMTMTTYMFKAHADAMVNYLRTLWSEVKPDGWDPTASIQIQVDTSQEVVERTNWLLKHKAEVPQ
jgi:hypothetical protein